MSLIPRFKYSYNFSDLVYSLTHLSSEKTNNLINFFNNSNIYSTNYARTGLYLLLKSISSNKILKVGVQVYTCHTILEAIKNAGCEIIFLDINENYTLDIESLQSIINNIDILIITHTFGIPADITSIKQIAKGKVVIEDCAHSLFSKFKGKQVGSFGDAAIFSIGYGKYPSIGPCGITLINNQKLLRNFIKLYNELPDKTIKDNIKNIVKNCIYSIAFNKILYGLITYPIGKKLDNKYDFIGKKITDFSKGFNSNVNLFNRNINKYKIISEKQIKNGLYFKREIEKNFTINWEITGANNFYIFPLQHYKRDQIVEELLTKGFEAGKHFSKSLQWATQYGYRNGDCPNTERIVNRILSVPVHYNLKKKQLDKIVATLKEFSK